MKLNEIILSLIESRQLDSRKLANILWKESGKLGKYEKKHSTIYLDWMDLIGHNHDIKLNGYEVYIKDPTRSVNIVFT